MCMSSERHPVFVFTSSERHPHMSSGDYGLRSVMFGDHPPHTPRHPHHPPISFPRFLLRYPRHPPFIVPLASFNLRHVILI